MSEFLVVAGMSGAGRSTAAATLEDLGWFVIDNLPAALFTKVAELVGRPGSETDRVALVIGRGGGEHLDQLDEVLPVLDSLTQARHRVRVLFLDAPDEVLVRRFEGTRRRHPLAARGVERSVAEERRLLEVLRNRADILLDTGELNANQLRQRLLELFGVGVGEAPMQTSILSFGYKHGIPLDVDIVFDCRFLPNPHWVESLRPYSGLDAPVRDYVLGQPETGEFLDRVEELLVTLVPAFVREGKSYLTVAMGCTGGRHRSVALAAELSERLAARGVASSVFHRDVDR
jgi:RNase adapter protein RapZ